MPTEAEFLDHQFQRHLKQEHHSDAEDTYDVYGTQDALDDDGIEEEMEERSEEDYEEIDDDPTKSSGGVGDDDMDSPMAYSESAEILSKKYMIRDQKKMEMEEEERVKRLMRQRRRRLQIQKWQQKTTKSPFKVNLVADNERLDEENRIRIMEEARRAKELERRAKQAKNEVILKALSETSDLELLRREKRAILEEEKRLKALMDLEKTNSHRKLDLIAARNAEKKRRQEKEEFRRKQRQQELEMREQRYRQLLKEKLAIDDRIACMEASQYSSRHALEEY